MPATATSIVLTAGTITFANEWWQAREIEWRIPIATVFAAAIFEGLASVDAQAATGIAVIILLASLTTRVHGKSIADSVGDVFNAKPPKAVPKGPPVQAV